MHHFVPWFCSCSCKRTAELRHDPNRPRTATTLTRCLVRLCCKTVLCQSVKQWPFFLSHKRRTEWLPTFLVLRSVCLASRNSHSALVSVSLSLFLCFPFFLSASSDKVDVAVCCYSWQNSRSKLLSLLSPPANTVPSLHLYSSCFATCSLQSRIWRRNKFGCLDNNWCQWGAQASHIFDIFQEHGERTHLGGRGFKQTADGSLICCFSAFLN